MASTPKRWSRRFWRPSRPITCRWTVRRSSKISGINRHVWLSDTLTKLAAGHPANAVSELMPWTAVG
ncbi:transposase domain-containing protein [Novosphingobium sp. PP1Y]|uniref:transposase domain-containing protein n=1 Tax=Novosphingobium sp. PP1Y TaxID=702113 RepID=UPI0013149229